MKPWYSLEGKSIWVTGGAGYLGSAVTEALDSAQAQTICIDLEGRAEQLVREKGLKRTVPFSLDVSDAGALPRFIDQLVSQHGVPDGVAHLAFSSSSGKRLEELTVQDFQKSLDSNLPPIFVLCRSIAEHMKGRGNRSIVLFSSMYGIVAPDPRIYHLPLTPNPIDYGAAKAAVLQLARYFAIHYGPAGIRFNCVTPGPFPNPNIQKSYPGFIADLASKNALHRIGRNTEIVGPTLFLLGDGSSFVNGHSLVVDGGWTVW